MFRSLIARVASMVLVVGLLVVASALSAPSSEAARNFKPWGTVTSRNHVLEKGCRPYRYRYKITAPNDQWSAEIFFISPNGTGLASKTLDTNSNPDKGRLRLKVCRASTSYGKHKIRMKITYSEGRDTFAGFVKPSSFRFTRPR